MLLSHLHPEADLRYVEHLYRRAKPTQLFDVPLDPPLLHMWPLYFRSYECKLQMSIKFKFYSSPHHPQQNLVLFISVINMADELKFVLRTSWT